MPSKKLPKLGRIKGKNGKHKGSYRFNDGKRSINTGTTDVDEAIKREAGYFDGTWSPDGAPDPVRDLAAAAAAPPADEPASRSPFAPMPEETAPPPAPAADATGVSAATALNDAAQADAPKVEPGAAAPAAAPEVGLNEILESVGIKPDEVYTIGGGFLIDLGVWLEGKGIQRIVGVEPPPLPYEETDKDGNPTKQAQIAKLVRALGAAGLAAEGKRWAPNLGDVPPLAVAGVALVGLGVMQFFAARDLASARKAEANRPREVRHEQPEPAAAAA